MFVIFNFFLNQYNKASFVHFQFFNLLNRNGQDSIDLYCNNDKLKHRK